MKTETLYGLTFITRRRICTLCRNETPVGLVGVMKKPDQSCKILCEYCLSQECVALGLAMQGIHLMRQAAGFRLARARKADEAEQVLLQFSLSFEQRVRHAWPRPHPLAKIDCEHCVLAAFQLGEVESEVLRAAFRTYQRFRDWSPDSEVLTLHLLEFGDFSECQRKKALERLNLFLTVTNRNALCPRSIDETALAPLPLIQKVVPAERSTSPSPEE